MKILVVCGATATGKSEIAVECARRADGEIISCDALNIYRGLNIGTAKPTEEERGKIPHYMIDVASPFDCFSVSDFEARALPLLNDIIARGKTPILCGGTGFYMNALIYSHSFGGAGADRAVRERYEAIGREKGREYLHALLREVDAESAEKLHPNDVKRVVRALEIAEVTGRKKSEQRDGRVPRYPFVCFAVNYDREELYRRIDGRVDRMLAAGLLDEVRGLLAEGVAENAQCMQGIGYKEVVDFLKNRVEYSTMSDIIKKNTRNYAKRQLTFFKRMENLHWLVPKEAGEAAEEILEIYGR